MKTIATIAAALLLSAPLTAGTPAFAEEAPPAECPVVIQPEIVAMDGPDAINQVIELRNRVSLLDSHIAFLNEQRVIDDRTIAKQGQQINRQQATIRRLRAKLAASR